MIITDEAIGQNAYLAGVFIDNLPIVITANKIPFYQSGNETSQCQPTKASIV